MAISPAGGVISIRGGQTRTGQGSPIKTGNAYLDQVLNQFQQASSSSQAAQRANFSGALTGAQDLYGKYAPMVESTPDMYRDLSGAYGDRTTNLMGMLGGFGDFQREELLRGRDKAGGAAIQNMVSRGLTNTTALGDRARGIESDYQRNLRGLNDTLNRQQMDYSSGLTGQELQSRALVPQATMQAAQQGFEMGMAPIDVRMQRQDVGPDMGVLSSLATMAGRSMAPQSGYPGVGSGKMTTLQKMRQYGTGVGVGPGARYRDNFVG